MVANVYLEGTYTERYPNIPRNETGLQRLFNEPMRNFRIVFDNPDLIACTVIGDGEAETGPLAARLAAVDILRKEIPELKIRVVNVVDLMTLQPQSEHPHGLSDHDFNSIFTTDKPIVFAFHGYPWLIHRLTYRRANHNNLHVRGYKEEGTTTTPFDMTVLNEMSRFHLAGMAIERVARLQNRAGYANQRIRGKLLAHREYICKHGDDMPEIRDWTWPSKTPATNVRSNE